MKLYQRTHIFNIPFSDILLSFNFVPLRFNYVDGVPLVPSFLLQQRIPLDAYKVMFCVLCCWWHGVVVFCYGTATYDSSYPCVKVHLEYRARKETAGSKCCTNLQSSLTLAKYEFFYMPCYAFLGVSIHFYFFSIFFSQYNPAII